MEVTDLAKYRQQLLTRQEQLIERIIRSETEIQALTSERRIEHMDRAQADIPETVLAQLDNQSHREFWDIQDALGRIEVGTYGLCESCGEAINPQRLDILPMARYCVACQKRLE